jgi:hypothetical protein
MTAVFADTFYWIAPTLPRDAAYERAQQVMDDIVTTEEVLTEYLTFFSEAPEYLRREVAANVGAMLSDPGVVRLIPQSIIPQSRIPLSRDSNYTVRAPTKGTA